MWIIRQWCSLDSYWEHVRENKDFDVAYKSPDLVLNEIKRIVEKLIFNPMIDFISSKKKVKTLKISEENKEVNFSA